MKISKKRAHEKLKDLMPDASEEKINEIINGDYSYKESESDVMKRTKKIAIIFLIVITILCCIILGVGLIQDKLMTALSTLPLLVTIIGSMFVVITKLYFGWEE